MNDFLVIGYGNTLRRDDGAGPWVAERIKLLLGVQECCVAVPQLLPELAEVIAQTKCVWFVDARQDALAVQIQLLEPVGESNLPGTHLSDAATLLTLASNLYGCQPLAWLVTVPAVDFDYGEGLSDFTRQGAEFAVQWIITEVKRLHAAMPP